MTQQQEDFEPGELDRLLEEGERSGESLDADEVFAEIRALSAARRKAEVAEDGH